MPKLSAGNASVNLALITMTSYGANTHTRIHLHSDRGSSEITMKGSGGIQKNLINSYLRRGCSMENLTSTLKFRERIITKFFSITIQTELMTDALIVSAAIAPPHTSYVTNARRPAKSGVSVVEAPLWASGNRYRIRIVCGKDFHSCARRHDYGMRRN
ncbi:hypothetical protein EVAR_23063_1 [Eumeta japonica]|uniref:Uncharacterized protein n=1 Tax=Eumeta variegata TaxID=151549 RepID=A0A4C1VKV7_EUMVA|nr:hypothetical protein EVAR_23063_1 [Eumeta japonica]